MEKKLLEEARKYIASFSKDVRSVVVEHYKPKHLVIADHTEVARVYIRKLRKAETKALMNTACNRVSTAEGDSDER